MTAHKTGSPVTDPHVQKIKHTLLDTAVEMISDGRIFQGLSIAGIVGVGSLIWGLHTSTLQMQQQLWHISGELAEVKLQVVEFNRLAGDYQANKGYVHSRLSRLEDK